MKGSAVTVIWAGGHTWSDEGRIQGLDPIGGHDDLDVSSGVKSVQLVEELQHGSLDLTLASRVGVIPSGDGTHHVMCYTLRHLVVIVDD